VGTCSSFFCAQSSHPVPLHIYYFLAVATRHFFTCKLLAVTWWACLVHVTWDAFKNKSAFPGVVIPAYLLQSPEDHQPS
jgi:hypothetical protein